MIFQIGKSNCNVTPFHNVSEPLENLIKESWNVVRTFSMELQHFVILIYGIKLKKKQQNPYPCFSLDKYFNSIEVNSFGGKTKSKSAPYKTYLFVHQLGRVLSLWQLCIGSIRLTHIIPDHPPFIGNDARAALLPDD